MRLRKQVKTGSAVPRLLGGKQCWVDLLWFRCKFGGQVSALRSQTEMQSSREVVWLVWVGWEELNRHLAHEAQCGVGHIWGAWTLGKPKHLLHNLISMRADPCGNVHSF